LDKDEFANLVNMLTDILCEIDLLNICDVRSEYDIEAKDIAERMLLRKEELSPNDAQGGV